eukprot:6201658-Pleurochrysis_carterae.AAC.1
MEGYVGYPRDTIGCIRSAAVLHVVPVAANGNTMIYMGLRAILGEYPLYPEYVHSCVSPLSVSGAIPSPPSPATEATIHRFCRMT